MYQNLHNSGFSFFFFQMQTCQGLQGKTRTFDQSYYSLICWWKTDSVHDSPCLESLDWIQRYRETEPHPHAHTELRRGERSPQTAITEEHASVISYVSPRYTLSCTARMPVCCMGCSPLPITQLQSAEMWQIHHHLTGYFFKGLPFSELIFLLSLFQVTATMGFLCHMRWQLCVQLVLKHSSYYCHVGPLCPAHTNTRSWPNTLVYPGVFWSLHVITCNLLLKLYEKEMLFLLRE